VAVVHGDLVAAVIVQAAEADPAHAIRGGHQARVRSVEQHVVVTDVGCKSMAGIAA